VPRSPDDIRYMRRALSLASRAWGRTSPNPMVGAVVVRDDHIVGEGWHHQAGTPHAEVHALRAAGDAARGATLYVTLEPCSTTGRTPPCTDAVLQAGVARVVVAMADPNPEHAGRGLHLLAAAGIDVDVGVCGDRAAQLNEAFACWTRFRRPLVILKLAATLDGRIATATGDSQWITSPASRRAVQRLRQGCDAIMVGGETVRRDNPQLLVRSPARWPCQPLRLIASRSGELGPAPQVLTDGLAETRIVHASSPGRWRSLLTRLGGEGITCLLVEGGGELAAELLNADVVDKVVWFQAPRILGGRGSRPAVGGPDPTSLSASHDLQDVTVTRYGIDLMITGYLHDVYRLD